MPTLHWRRLEPPSVHFLVVGPAGRMGSALGFAGCTWRGLPHCCFECWVPLWLMVSFRMPCVMQVVCLLLREGGDGTDLSSCHPLGLLSSDRRVVAKVLAGRLSGHIATLIRSGWAGFVSERFGFLGARGLLGIVCSGGLPRSAVVSLDAQRVFGRVGWECVFVALGRFSFGDRFLAVAGVLYAHPSSCVLTGGSGSSPFLLHRSGRRGCSFLAGMFCFGPGATRCCRPGKPWGGWIWL